MFSFLCSYYSKGRFPECNHALMSTSKVFIELTQILGVLLKLLVYLIMFSDFKRDKIDFYIRDQYLHDFFFIYSLEIKRFLRKNHAFFGVY